LVHQRFQPLASSSPFARGRWAFGFATALTVASVMRYPGGTLLDHRTEGYSATSNFLSDLGMTVAYDGSANRLGSLLFVIAVIVAALGVGACVPGFVRLHSDTPRARRFARAAAVVGFAVCAAFIGVALTPEDRVLGLHVWFTFQAFRVFPLVTLLFALASRASPNHPRRLTIAWVVLTSILLAYVGVLEWGPRLTTPGGLMTQVIAQKVVAISAVVVGFFLSLEADRLRAATR
jgi:hypothetical protein